MKRIHKNTIIIFYIKNKIAWKQSLKITLHIQLNFSTHVDKIILKISENLQVAVTVFTKNALL